MRNQSTALESWVCEELDQRGLNNPWHSRCILSMLRPRQCVCKHIRTLKPSPSFRIHDLRCPAYRDADRKQILKKSLFKICTHTAGLNEFVDEICCRLRALEVEDSEQSVDLSSDKDPLSEATSVHPYEASWSEQDSSSSEDEGLQKTLQLLLPKLSFLNNEDDGFESTFEDLELDSFRSTWSGKRLYERGWESPSHKVSDSDEQLREFTAKVTSIAELWGEMLELDKVSLWFPQENESDLLSLLSLSDKAVYCNARRKLSFNWDEDKMETEEESDVGVDNKIWVDPMWQVERCNSLSLETDVTLNNVAEEMARGVLEDDGQKCDDCPDKSNCSQQFVHHAHKSCFKTVLPGSTRYVSSALPQYRKTARQAENLLLSSRTHFKPIRVEDDGADVEEIEKDAISEVEHEFAFLHGYDTPPSVVKSVLEPLDQSPTYYVDPSIWECSIPSNTDTQPGDDERRAKLREESLQEGENLFADIDCEVKWNTLEYENEEVLPAFAYPQQELCFDLPAIPANGRVLYSTELEEDWKLNSKPFSVQVPKKNKNRKVTANKKACHYFLGGRCSRDADCRYSHDPASITCRFWEQESCLKGITCEFLHAYNHSPITTRRRQHSEGANDRCGRSKRGRPRKQASFEITSHTDFPELSVPQDETEDSSKAVKKQLMRSSD